LNSEINVFNPLSPANDQCPNSPCNIMIRSNIQIMRMKKMIFDDKVLVYPNSPNLCHKKFVEGSEENMQADIGLKGLRFKRVL